MANNVINNKIVCNIFINFIYLKFQVKQNLDSKSNVTVTTKEMKPQKNMLDNDWKASNSIGEELMRRMGWTGGGLGKSEQGVVEPMSTMLVYMCNISDGKQQSGPLAHNATRFKNIFY